MQTSLARRERRRRNGSAGRARGGGAGSKVAVVLPIFLLATLLLGSVVTFASALQMYDSYAAGLSDPKNALESIPYNQQTVLYDRTGTVQLAAFGSENRRVLKFSEIPNVVLDATTSAEDKTFWKNTGFDPAAVLSSIRDAISGHPRGASTITQQLVRTVPNMLPVTTSTVDRKIKEIIQSVKLTQDYPGEQGKEAIITAYLNLNFFGNQSYGIASAAEGYFGVTDLSKLTIAQAVIIAATLQAPSAFDLVYNAIDQGGTLVVPNSKPIVQRRNGIIEDMHRNWKDGLLRGNYTEADFTAALAEPVILHPAPRPEMKAPQFDLLVRQELISLICGDGNDGCGQVDTGGYKVITTLDWNLQQSAEKWLKAYIMGPNQGSTAANIAYLAQPEINVTAKNDSYNYSRIIGPSSTSKNGLQSGNIHNGALISLDYRNGQVLTYAGSADFYADPVKDPGKPGSNYFDPQYDVLSSGIGRQPGSAFKPINYLIGIQDTKLTAASLFMDVATDFGGGYKPHDADGYERGPVRLREALQYSLNIPAVKAASINGVSHVMQRAQDFGLQFPDNADPGLSIGVGTVEVRPADLVSAYGAIADGGTLVERNLILSIQDSKGLPAASIGVPKTSHPSTPQATYVMTSILAGNTDPSQNNWWSQYKLMEGKTRRPATLKTGTSDQTEDLMAVGYTAPPNGNSGYALVTGVWAGNSDRAPGKSVMSLELAAPIWHAFMQDATKGTPVTDFRQPDGVSWATVDANSGLVPGPFTTQTVKEVFIDGTVPSQVDNTKVPVDVDSDTNTLWTWDCPGTQVTKGFLDLSQVEANNANWQKYDQIWIARAQKGVGQKGGPNNGATMYFYETGFWTPFGQTWGAPFPPTTTCTANTGTPPPSLEPTPTPEPTPSPTPTPEITPTPKPTHPPKPTPTATPTDTPTPTPTATPAG